MNTSILTCFDPIFVVGCPRSGTSILSHTLSKHSENWLSAESDFMIPLLRSLKPVYENGVVRENMHWLVRQKVSYEEFRKSIMVGVNALYTNRSKGKRWVEQTPAYSLIINELAEVFPDAVFVHIQRNGREVVNSMINSDFGQEWSDNFDVACKTWNDYLTKLLTFEKANPARIIKVRNENLKNSPEKVLKRICEFLQIEYEKKMLEFIESRKGMNSSFTTEKKVKENWESSWNSSQKKKFLNICGETMQTIGYE